MKATYTKDDVHAGPSLGFRSTSSKVRECIGFIDAERLDHRDLIVPRPGIGGGGQVEGFLIVQKSNDGCSFAVRQSTPDIGFRSGGAFCLPPSLGQILQEASAS